MDQKRDQCFQRDHKVHITSKIKCQNIFVKSVCTSPSGLMWHIKVLTCAKDQLMNNVNRNVFLFPPHLSQEGRGGGSAENRTWRDGDGGFLFDFKKITFPKCVCLR